MYERELERQTELAAARRDLYERGALSERELQDGRRGLIAAQKEVDDMRRAMAEADRMTGEARMVDVGRQRPLARGAYEEIPGLVRFSGLAEWSLTTDTPKLQRLSRGSAGLRPLAPLAGRGFMTGGFIAVPRRASSISADGRFVTFHNGSLQSRTGIRSGRYRRRAHPCRPAVSPADRAEVSPLSVPATMRGAAYWLPAPRGDVPTRKT
jgi:hypothetical protein